MKLRALTTASLSLTLLGLVLIAGLGLWTWQGVTAALDQVREFAHVRQQAHELGTSLDYLILVRSDMEVIRELRDDARQLAGRLAREPHLAAQDAVRRLHEIAALMQILEQRHATDSVPAPAATLSGAMRALTPELRAHEAVVQKATDSLLEMQHEEVVRALLRGLGLFLAASLGFAALAALSSWRVRRRLGAPLRRIQHGLAEFSAGKLDTRIDLSERDELGMLAAAFNDMADHRRESELRLHFLARATVDTVRDWDLRSDRVWWNDGLQNQFGYAPQAIEPDARSWSVRLHPEAAEQLRADLDAAFASQRDTWEAHYHFRRADGSYARVVERAFIIRDGQGQAMRLVGGMTDITSRLDLEERLRRAQRLESVGQLTGGVAHDFNNLLTVIQGNAELLSEDLAADPRRRALASMIMTAARRGAELTQRLLAFARKQTLEPRVVDVNAMLADTHELLTRALGEQVEIALSQDQDLWPALVDPAQLESALLNLCLNARDAMPAGGKLTIETDNVMLDEDYASAHAEVEPGQYVRVAVSDTGEGMQPEILARVFEPFFSTKRGKGTGLGLPMVYGFLQQSGGHINIYSEPYQGTTVRMYLPRATGEPSQPEQDAPALAPSGGERILMVEDDELVRGYVLEQLRSLGYEVLEAENGPRALALLREGTDVDLLFTDIVMPGGMNGRELAEAARAIRPGLRVLFTSGYTENAIAHHGALDPGTDLLAKPYRRADLALKIRRSLSSQYS